MKPHIWLWLVIGSLTLGRLGISSQLELAEDEAYYWLWSQQLSTGYFDHPPAIAYAIRLGTELLGHTEQGVRFVTILLGGIVAWLCATVAPFEERQPDQAVRTALILSVLPLFALGGILATPDVPLASAWALGIWAAARNRTVLLGLACGLAMLSKYTGILLLPCILLAQPQRWQDRRTWLVAAIAGLIYLPNAIWNVEHDLISWQFQLMHASEGGHQLDFLGAQIGLVSPFLFFVFFSWWCIGWRGTPIERLCWWTSVPVLLIALVSGGEANWGAPAYVSTAVGVGCRVGKWRLASWVTASLASMMSVIFLIHMMNPIFDIRGDPRARLNGGKTLAQAVDAWDVPMVVTSRYQEAGWISFYGQTPAVALPSHSRPNQFDIWPTPLPEHTLYIRVADGERTPAILSRGYHSLGVHEVQAEMPTSDPSIVEIIRDWQLYEVVRSESNR